MATKYGVNATLIAAVPPSRAGIGEQGGRVRVIYDSYTLTADLTGGTDSIAMGGKIPAGARILDVHIKCADLDGSGGTIDVGWEASSDAVEAADPDGFMTLVDVTSADVFKMSDDDAAPVGLYKKFTAAVQPAIAITGDTDATSGSIQMAIYYTLD